MSELGFEDWKKALRDDCVSQDKLASFNALGEYVLQVLWLRGIEPSVMAISAQDVPSSKVGAL